ncbi:MAG: hypothetical protein RIS17_1808 [Pseudomonadota bacterium]
MIEPATALLIVMAGATLLLNVYAMRADAAAAGLGRKQLVRMGAMWATIITALTLTIASLEG